jgi:hypothetical protein
LFCFVAPVASHLNEQCHLNLLCTQEYEADDVVNKFTSVRKAVQSMDEAATNKSLAAIVGTLLQFMEGQLGRDVSTHTTHTLNLFPLTHAWMHIRAHVGMVIIRLHPARKNWIHWIFLPFFAIFRVVALMVALLLCTRNMVFTSSFCVWNFSFQLSFVHS